MALAISSFLARQGCAGMRTAQLCEKPVPAPCPVLVKAASGVKATGFEMISSLSRGGSELSISCWARTWVAQSRCDPSALPSATLGKHPFTDLYQLPARAASADGSDFLLGSEMLPQHGRERIVLSWDGTSFPATPAVISVFFIDRPQNTLQKKYHSS